MDLRTTKYQDIESFKLPPNFRGRSNWVVILWWFTQKTLFAWSPIFLYQWRNFLLRFFGAKIGKKVLISPSVRIIYPWRLSIGDYSWIGENVELYTLNEISIGHDTVISQRSYICSGGHDYLSPTFDTTVGSVYIGNEVWIATDVFVSPGVHIGNAVVVGARSNVFSDLPDGMICYGSPAKVVKERKPKDTQS